ncbi:MAG: toxin TcdB middle/N-terminal domain-containing protein, partial [Steroidobacteraceae bacterium]
MTFTLPEETFILDWDSDGRDDVLFDNGGYLGVYRSRGASLDPVPIATSVPYAVGGYVPMDPNGDGVTDLIHGDAYSPNAVVLYKRSEIVELDALTLAVPDLATKFTDGYGVSYEPKYTTTANSQVYTRGATAVDELREAPEARVVVRSVIAPDGTGSTFETKYTYAGARSDYWRSETVGFEQRTTIDMRNNLRRRTTFKQGFPFTGRIAKDELLKPDGVTLISETSNEYDSHSYGQQYPNVGVISKFPFLHASTTKRYDLTSALIATTTTTNTVDAPSGGLTEQVTTVVEAATANGVQASVEHRYEVHNTLFSASGCAGRPATTEEERSVTNGATITRKTTTTWSATHCRPAQVDVEPDQASWRITTVLAYDAFGNVNRITQTPDASQTQEQRVSAINWGTTGQFPHGLTNPQSQSAALVWDLDLGVPTEVIEANGAHSYSVYDEFGRLERETRADGTRTDFALTACLASNSYCAGAADFRFRLNASFYNSDNYSNPDRVDSQYFDAFERPRYSDVTLPDGAMSRTIVTYDALGRIATQTVPHKSGGPTGPTTFAYDLLNRLLSATRQAGELDTSPISTVISYPGLQREVTDAEGKSRTLTYDAVGRV